MEDIKLGVFFMIVPAKIYKKRIRDLHVATVRFTAVDKNLVIK